MLVFPDQQPFATGRMEYVYGPVTEQGKDNRLLLRVELEDLSLLAVVDTGAPYVVLEPNLASQLQFDPDHAIENTKLKIRGIEYLGYLYRANLLFVASQGESLNIEVTLFVPDTEEQHWGDLPSFLGMTGCLERLRFAVDPNEDVFYFGAI